MRAATLIYPHQLFSESPALRQENELYLIEDPLLFGTDRHHPLRIHQQRLVLHRASMKAYAADLEGRGLKPHYVDLPKGGNSDSITILRAAIPKSVQHLEVCDPHDDILLRRLRRFAAERDITIEVHPSPNFLTPADFLAKHTGTGLKRPFMANFYKAQRKRMEILVDKDASPDGGKWSFDEENRKRLPNGHPVPAVPSIQPNDHVQEAVAWTRDRFADHPGSLGSFAWPVTRRAALSWLKNFLEKQFTEFGDFEDAISREHRVLFHSLLTPSLNIGLITPREVIDHALEYAGQGNIPMNSLEGFLRQIIGWREFMAGIYLHRGVSLRNSNFWNHQRKIPKSFYDGTTGIAPFDDTIHRVLEHGYCHHIERLMILGNFMLLCRIHPEEVYRWFMELFVDAYDWVMVPNVFGMSQFADGGSFTTKPYISGSNYIRKMSDYPKGDWCEVWDGLYWTFIADHLDVFMQNHRLSMMARSWERMDSGKKSSHRQNAHAFLDLLG